jgi:hypothetical protein
MRSHSRVEILVSEEVSAMSWFGIHSRVVAVVALVVGTVAVALLIQHDTTQRGPVAGSGTAVTEYRTLPGFMNVKVLGTDSVVIHAGRPQTVAVSADDNLVSSVSTTVDSGRLVIDEPASFYLTGTGNVVGSGSVKRLTTTLSGTGNIDLSRLSSWDVFATLGGTGRIVVNAVHTLHARVPGTGAIHYVGNPAFVDEHVTGTGVVAPA